MSPRIFKDADKAAIREKLITEGKRMFQRYGLGKTNVADLAHAAGIAKGTFYHFFESKEDLCLAIFEREEVEAAKEVESTIDKSKNPAQTLKNIIAFSLDFIRNDSLLTRIRESGDFSRVERGVSPEKLAAHLTHDIETARKVITAIHAKGASIRIPAEVLAGIFRAIVLLALQPGMIGEKVFNPVMANITSWIIQGLLKGQADS